MNKDIFPHCGAVNVIHGTLYFVPDTVRFRRPSAGVPPLPIPNREVKPCCADGTGVTPGRVGRRRIIQKPAEMLAFLRLKELGIVLRSES